MTYQSGQQIFSWQSAAQRFQTVLDQLLLGAISERIQMLLQIGPGTLRPRSDRHGLAAKVVGARLHLVDVRSLIIVAGNQQANAERASVVALRARLHLVADVHDQPGHRIHGVVGELVVQTLLAHVAAQHTRIGRDASDRDAQMRVDGDDFLLVRRQFGRGSLQSNQDGMIASLEANSGRAQLHGLHGVFDLMQSALRAPHGHIAVVLVAKLRGMNTIHFCRDDQAQIYRLC